MANVCFGDVSDILNAVLRLADVRCLCVKWWWSVFLCSRWLIVKFSFQTTRSGCTTYRVDCGVCECVSVCERERGGEWESERVRERESVCVCVCVCNALWSPELEPIDSRNALWSPELNQLTREMRSEAPNWTNWLAKCALKPRTEPMTRENALWSPELNHDSRNSLWSPELNQLTREKPLWSPRDLNQPDSRNDALRPRTEPIDSQKRALKPPNGTLDLRNALWSPELNQLTQMLWNALFGRCEVFCV